MMPSLLTTLMGAQAASPPAWPSALHMTGTMNGTTEIMGISIGPVQGPFELWSSCDRGQPHQAKLKFSGSSQAYGVTVLNTTVTQLCQPSATDDGTLIEDVAVPYLPSVCVGLPIATGLANCAACPSYGLLPLTCSSWISAPSTLQGTPVTVYTSTGCQNQTTTVAQPDGSALSIVTLMSVDVFYPVNGQSPLRIVIHQQLWEDIPNAGQIHTTESSTLDITKFEMASIGAASFQHCTPSHVLPGR